jgi:hypothetical protein
MKTLLKISRFFLVLFLMNCFPKLLQAQDTLVYQNGDKRIIYVNEIGLDEIKFRNLNDCSDVIRVIEKSEVKEIRMYSHEIVRFKIDPMEVKFTDQELRKTHALKFNFLSPMFNHIAFSYETVLKPWINLEVEAGLLGVGFSTRNDNASGGLIRTGFKFIRKPDFKLRGQKLSHPLHGKYIKPELIFNHYTKTVYESSSYYNIFGPTIQTATNLGFTNIALNLNFGKQSYLGGGFLVDTYLGVGYGVQLINRKSSNKNANYNYHDGFPFSHVQGDEDFPISFTFGIRLGFAL